MWQTLCFESSVQSSGDDLFKLTLCRCGDDNNIINIITCD